MEIDEGDLTDTIPFHRMKIGPLSRNGTHLHAKIFK